MWSIRPLISSLKKKRNKQKHSDTVQCAAAENDVCAGRSSAETSGYTVVSKCRNGIIVRSSVPRVSGSVPPVVLIQPREQISQLPPIEALELAIELERVALELELGALRVLFQEFKYSVKKIFWSA